MSENGCVYLDNKCAGLEDLVKPERGWGGAS
jgi:hypothetical protein